MALFCMFESVGIDHFIQGNFDVKTFNKFLGYITRTKQFEDINSKSSLNLFPTLNVQCGTQKYLINLNDFDGSRLKFLARTNALPTNNVLYRMKTRQDSVCDNCQSNAVEDLKHLILECPLYTNFRNNLLLSITEFLSKENVDVDFTGLPPLDKVRFLIGDLGYIFSESVGDFIDFKCKEFLINVFSKRSQFTSTVQ